METKADKPTLIQYRNQAYPGLEKRRIDVWLPPQYEQEPARRFRVLYMHDGQNIFNRSAITGVGWNVHGNICTLSERDEITPPIVVGLSSTFNRIGEYTPEQVLEDPGAEAYFRKVQAAMPYLYKGIASDAYLRFIVNDVKARIDRDFRTLPGAESTFIMGSSMGGLISLYAFCCYPQVFGGAACLSTHWPILGAHMQTWCQNRLPEPGQKRLYFDHGTVGLDATYVPYQEAFDKLLQERGYRPEQDFLSRVFPGADHNESAWAERLPVPLRFLLGRAKADT